jgi:uncharacterized protein (DUF2236 family)
VRSYLRIVYGTESTAMAEIRRLNGLHRAVAGPVRDPAAAARFGASYAARDPDLSLWVHATLVDSTLVTVGAWLGPLTRDSRARAYAETIKVGRRFGVPADRLPADIDAFDAYVETMLAPTGPVHPTAIARDLAAAILHPPLAPLASTGPMAAILGPAAGPVAAILRHVPASGVAWLLLPAIGLLPPGVRADYGLRWGPGERLVSAWLETAWRAWRPVLPPGWRWFPQALEAYARVGQPIAGTRA